MSGLLKSRGLYILFLLPFVVAAIICAGICFSPLTLSFVQPKSLIDFAFMNEWGGFWKSVTEGILILGVAYAVFGISEKFKLLSQTTTLPSVIYVLLIAGIVIHVGLGNLLIAVLLITFAVERLQTAINDLRTNQSLFDFGCLIALVVAIYPKSVLLVLWAFCVLFFSGRSTLKDLFALLLGLLTPVVFIVFHYFWTDKLDQLPIVFVRNLVSGEYIRHLSVVEIIRLAGLSFILLVALLHLLGSYSLMIVSQRRGTLALVSMLLFLSLNFFVVPGSYYDFMYLMTLPLTFIYAYFFIASRNGWFVNILFFLLVGACLLTYFV